MLCESHLRSARVDVCIARLARPKAALLDLAEGHAGVSKFGASLNRDLLEAAGEALQFGNFCRQNLLKSVQFILGHWMASACSENEISEYRVLAVVLAVTAQLKDGYRPVRNLLVVSGYI
jgi:hypothetical protein